MDIEKKILITLEEKFGYLPDDIKPESNLKNDLDMDSIDIVELVMDIENTFDISIPDEKIEDFKTVRNLSDFVETLVEKKSSN